MADASIKAYFGGDTTQLQAAIMSAHAMTNKFAKDSANVFQEVGRAETSLAAFRKQADLERGAGFNRDIVLQREIQSLNAQINSIEGQTVQKMELQLQLDQKILLVERNIASAAQQNTASLSSAENTLAAFRKKSELERGAGFQQHIILQREIREINAQINAIEGQTVQKLELQLQLDQKILSLEQSIAQTARQSASSGGGPRAAAVGAAEATKQTTLWGRSLNKVIGLGPALKGLFAGLGIASVSMIVDKLVDRFRKAADLAKEIEDLTARAADSNIELMRSRLSDEDRLSAVIKDRARLQREYDSNARKTEEDTKRALTDELLLNAKIKEEETLRAKIGEDAAKRVEENHKASRERQKEVISAFEAREKLTEKEVKKQQELADAVDKALTRHQSIQDKLFRQKLESATVDERLVLLTNKRAEIMAVQNQYAENSDNWNEQQVELNEINVSIEKTRLEIAEKTAAAEGNITKNKEKQTRIGFETATQSIFSDTSDATLREIVRRERERVLSIAANTGNITEIISRAGSQQRLAAAQSELDVRKKTLYNASVGGEERARQLFKGDPMEFDKFYSQLTAGVNKDDKIIETLEKTNNLLAGKFRNQ